MRYDWIPSFAELPSDEDLNSKNSFNFSLPFFDGRRSFSALECTAQNVLYRLKVSMWNRKALPMEKTIRCKRKRYVEMIIIGAADWL